MCVSDLPSTAMPCTVQHLNCHVCSICKEHGCLHWWSANLTNLKDMRFCVSASSFCLGV